MAKQRPDLVTGAAGFTGLHVVKALRAEGRRVVATDLPGMLADEAHMGMVRRCGVDPEDRGITWVPADLLEPDTLAPLFAGANAPARVFHVASLYDYSAPLSRLRRINVEGTRNLLAFAVEADLERFVHWSTCGVFGKPWPASAGKKSNLPFSEASPSPKNSPPGATQPAGTQLVNAYSVSKWEQEQLVWEASREQGLAVTVVRPAPIYGPGSTYGHNGIIIAIARGLVPVLPADARNAVTTSVHVEDIAGFAVWIASREEGRGEDFNVVDDSIISYYDFLKYIGLLTGRRMLDIPLVPLPAIRIAALGAAHAWTWLERNFGVPRVRVLETQSATYIGSSYWLSNRKTQRVGYRYRYPDVREGLKDTVAWLREEGWLAK